MNFSKITYKLKTINLEIKLYIFYMLISVFPPSFESTKENFSPILQNHWAVSPACNHRSPPPKQWWRQRASSRAGFSAPGARFSAFPGWCWPLCWHGGRVCWGQGPLESHKAVPSRFWNRQREVYLLARSVKYVHWAFFC